MQTPPRTASRRRSAMALAGALLLTMSGALPANAATDWSKQKVPTKKRLLDVAFANAKIGVAVGQAGHIVNTLDGGANWVDRTAPAEGKELKALATAASGCGDLPCFWAGGIDGMLLLSKDGGGTWCKQTTGTAEKIQALSALGSGEVVAVGTNGLFLRTTSGTDCEAEYTAENTGLGRILKGVARTPDGTTVVVGANGTILSRDPAGTFTPIPSGVKADLNAVNVTSGPGNGYTLTAVGEAGAVLRSTDGQSWTGKPATRFELNDVTFPQNHETGYAVGELGTIMVTTDAGQTWTRQKSGNCNHLFGIAMPTPEKGWAAGGSGTMLVQAANAKATEPNCALTGSGYRLVASDGGIFSFGEAKFYGSTGDIKLNQPIVGMASAPTGGGYWMVASDGGIFAFGEDAQFFGSTGDIKLNQPIVAMATTPSGEGYWLVASDGGVFSFGDAAFKGSTGDIKLNSPIVGMASTPDGEGYWMVAADGGIFAFGDAIFAGAAAGKSPAPIVAMASTPDGEGYWLVAADGAVFQYGDAEGLGNLSGQPLAKPIVGMSIVPGGNGYWMVASDGGIFAFGDEAQFYGSTGDLALNKPIVGMSSG